jgi:hypothetical protein
MPPIYQRPRDLIDHFTRLQERVRWLENKPKPIHTESKTFLVSGVVAAGFQPPPFIVSMSPLYDPTEDLIQTHPQDYRVMLGVRGSILDGNCHVRYFVNSTIVYSDLLVDSAAPQDHWVPIGHDLSDGDQVSILVTSASTSARDLAAAFLMTVQIWA